MEKNNLKSEKDYIDKYQDMGYTSNYRIANNNLIDLITKTEYKPADIKVVAKHRFEGLSNPGDMSILYIIEIGLKSKGTVLANYSPSSDTEMAEFFNNIPKENISQKNNILDFKI
ncbi:hypothetical protein GCM10022291_07870 [Postechiella marina]|uniref:Uncharacterized protein n=1 Tax=Postechiella marina TaxID=943941 RepID=A0ABP8C2W5_9FLAO